jgi:hypothetical protein
LCRRRKLGRAVHDRQGLRLRAFQHGSQCMAATWTWKLAGTDGKARVGYISAVTRPSSTATGPEATRAAHPRSARAADALRPLSRGANGRRPEIAFNHSLRCSP